MSRRSLLALSAALSLLSVSQGHARDRAFVGDVDSSGNVWVYGDRGKGTVILNANPREPERRPRSTTTHTPDGGWIVRFHDD